MCRVVGWNGLGRGKTEVAKAVHVKPDRLIKIRTTVLILNMLGYHCRILRGRTENKLQGGRGKQ